MDLWSIGFDFQGFLVTGNRLVFASFLAKIYGKLIEKEGVHICQGKDKQLLPVKSGLLRLPVLNP